MQKINNFINNMPYWLKIVITAIYVAFGCCAWGFVSSDYVFTELSKQTHMVGCYEVNLGVAWFYSHLAIMFGLVIALYVVLGTLLISWCVKGHKNESKITKDTTQN